MSEWPILEVREIELTFDANGRLGFGAVGQAVDEQRVALSGLPSVRLGLGHSATLPTKLASAFPELAAAPLTDEVFSLRTMDGVATDSAWYVSLGPRRQEFYYVQSLVGIALDGTGLKLQELQIKLAVRWREGRLVLVEATVVGQARLEATFFGLGMSTVTVQARLEIDVSENASLEKAMTAPGSLLEGAFKGRLVLGLGVRALPIGGNLLRLEGVDGKWQVDVSSPEGLRSLTLDTVGFTYQSAKLTVADVALTIPQVQGAISPSGRVEFETRGKIAFPDAWRLVLDQAPREADVRFSFLHRPGVNGSTRLALRLTSARLQPALNPLQIGQGDLALEMVHSSGGWAVSYRARLQISTTTVLSRLKAAGLPALTLLQGAGDVGVEFSVVFAPSFDGGRARLKIQSQDIRRPLGFDLDLAEVRLELEAQFSRTALSAWIIGGNASLSTTGALREALPLTRLAAGFRVQSDSTGAARVELSLQQGLPVLQLPAPRAGLTPLRLFQLTSLRVVLAEDLTIEAAASLLPGFQPSTFASSLGAPALDGLMRPLAEALRLVAGRVTLTVQAKGTGAEAHLQAIVRSIPDQPPAFNLLRLLNSLSGGASAPRSPGQAEADDGFFQVVPRGLVLGATIGGRHEELFFAAESDCTLLGERFSADLSLRLRPTGPELALVAGVRDPIRLAIPYPDLDGLLGAVDVAKLARDYQLAPPVRDALQEACDNFRRHFRRPESKEAFVFEVTDLGLRICPADTANPIAVSGSIRLVKAPPELNDLFGLEGFRVTLGATPESIYFSLGSDGSTPLLSFPTGPQGRAELIVRDLQFSYNWTQNAFAFAWNIDLRANPALGVATPAGGVFVPGLRSTASFGATATVPPVPIPEFSALFAPLGRPARRLVDDLGLQVYVGPDSQRLLTLYTQELTFSPTLYLFQPGIRFSGGFLVGGPRLTSSLRLAALRNQLVNPTSSLRQTFYCFVDIDRATVIAVNPIVGAMINPFCVVPPFLTATPPFWLAPPTLMADVYFEQLSLAVNLPGLVFASLQVSRPLVTPNLQQIAEMMALVFSGFSQPLPEGSSLEKLLFLKIRGDFELGLSGENRTRRTPLLDIEINLVDFINGMIALGRGAESVLKTGANLVDLLINDPTALVKLIPFAQRSVALGGSDGLEIGGLKVSGSGSVYLLTPDELEADLKVFHENRREVPRGLAAVKKKSTSPAVVWPGVAKDLPWTPRLTERISRKVFVKPERAFSVQDRVIQNFLARRAPLLEAEAKRQRIELAKLRARSALATGKVWDQFVAQVPSNGFRVSSTRRALLDRLGFEPEQIEVIEREIARLPRLLRVDQLTALRTKIVDTLLDEAGVLVHEPQEGKALQLLADQLFQQVTGPGPTAGAPLPPGAWRLPNAAQRLSRIEAVLPSENVARRTEINLVFDDEAPRLARGGPEAETARVITRQRLIRTLAKGGKRKVTAWREGLPKEVKQESLLQEVSKRLRPDRSLRDAVKDLVTLDLDRLRDNIGRLPVKPRPPMNAADVDIIVGFELVARVVPRGESAFSVPVAGLEVPFSVRQENGAYRIKTLGVNRDPVSSTLPAWLVAQETAGPGRAQRLRSRVKIQERRIRRSPTTEEQAAVTPIRHESARLYEEAIVFRPEYQVAPTGGRRGPLCLGDFLRRANGSYALPPGPALLAGVRVAVQSGTVTWFSLQLTGMLAPPSDALLFGRQEVTLRAGALSLHMKGEFRFLTGDLWANPGGGFQRDALSFSGSVVVKEGSRERFRADAEGAISNLGHLPSLSFRLRAALDFELSLDPGGEDLVRITAASQFSGSMDFSNAAGLRLHADAAVSISVWLLLPPMKRVERCIPFVGCLVSLEPQLLDFDEYELTRVADASAGLDFTVSAQGLQLELSADLRQVGGLNLGEHRLTLDTLN